MKRYKPLEQESKQELKQGLKQGLNFANKSFDSIEKVPMTQMDSSNLLNEGFLKSGTPSEQKVTKLRIRAAFWLLGLCSNSGYVIMVAGAKEINSGGVAVVFLFDVVPGFFVKLSAPYWFHLVPHNTRVLACGLLMIIGFILVGCGSSLGIQLFGVSLSSVQSALGEATFLSLAARYDSRWALTMWSSGTGMAGIFGYGYVYFLHVLWGFSFKFTLLSANLIAAALLGIFFFLLGPVPPKSIDPSLLVTDETCEFIALAEDQSGLEFHFKKKVKIESEALSSKERAKFVASLWPYMAPLCLVYFAEYCMQSGTWSAIGFPVSSEDARKDFYLYANWTYQVGVFFSRSSGILFSPPPWVIQVFMPLFQVVLLILFYIDSVYHFWYDYSLLIPCFVVGLLGGGVYVGSYILIAKKMPPERKELALGAASIADTVGVCLADLTGLYIQSCAYEANGIHGATVQCFL